MVPDKQEVMLHLMEDAWVYVHLDPRRDGVDLPDHLREDKRLILQYGYNMPVPISDLVVDKRGIAATLSFRRVFYSTFIPWAAVFGLTDGDKRTYVWEGDIPKDLLAQVAKEAGAVGEDPPQIGPRRVAEKPEQPEPQKKPEKPGKKPRPSHLKLVD